MKKFLFLALCGLSCIFSAHVSSQDATIKVDILRQIGQIDRNIYGVFMEPIRNTIDGLLYNPEYPHND